MTDEHTGASPTESGQHPGGGTREAVATGGTRRGLLLAAASLVLVALVVVTAVLLGGADDGVRTSGDGAAASTATPEKSAVPSGEPSAELPDAGSSGETPAEAEGEVESSDELPPAMPPVALDAGADVGGGLVVSIAEVESIQGTARGPGNVAGPALRITVRITNGTREPVSVDAVAVNLYSGPDDDPASPLDDPSQRPFRGSVPAGDRAEGTYVFSIPVEARDRVTVEVGPAPGAQRLLFTGSTG